MDPSAIPGFQSGISPYLFGANPRPNAQRPHYQVVRVKGENGARSFEMGPNSSAILADENDPVVWLVSTDGAGYKTVTPYTIVPMETKEQKIESTLTTIMNRLTRLEESINGKSDAGATV